MTTTKYPKSFIDTSMNEWEAEKIMFVFSSEDDLYAWIQELEAQSEEKK